MSPIHPVWLGAFYAASEIFISITLRSGQTAKQADRGSFWIIWGVINICAFGGIAAAYLWPVASFANKVALYWLGFTLFVLSLALRWYSIYYLGKFFTVNVAIASDHKVVDTGPYRYIRHPSYVGVLGAFLGLALCLGNLISLLLIFIPITAAFVRRMNVEEAALKSALGDNYRHYMARTKRLIPYVY